MGPKSSAGTILRHIRSKTNSIQGTSPYEGSDEERFALRRPTFQRFLHVREAGKARYEAKEDKATIEICSTELRSGETTARLPGGQFCEFFGVDPARFHPSRDGWDLTCAR